MTPHELKTIRNKLGLSQSGLALALGMAKNGDRTIRRMESGATPITQRTALAIQWLLYNK